MADVQAAIEHIYPLIFEFRKERSAEDMAVLQAAKRRRLSAGAEEIYDQAVAKEEPENNSGDEDVW